MLRTATTRAASASDSAPAMWAAAISPWEWPTTAAGCTPKDSHSRASDTMTANSAGCTTSTRSQGGGAGGAAQHVLQGPVDVLGEGVGAVAHGCCEDG